MAMFIEFQRGERGMFVIRSSTDREYYLDLGATAPYFSPRRFATKFVAKMCDNEAITFETSDGSAFEMRFKHCQARQSDGDPGQMWLVMTPFQLSSSEVPPASDLQRLAVAATVDSAARRQLIIHFSTSGKSSEEISKILILLYGSATPTNLTKTDEIKVERRRQIMKLVESGKSTKEIADILRLLYGVENDEEANIKLKGEVASTE